MITRFAPAPTGELHLGHVLHALWLWETAAVYHAPVLIRIEDHDRSRCTEKFEHSIRHDIEWLGFDLEVSSRRSLERHPSAFRQSDHPERYQRAFDALRKVADVYGCTCTRSMMEPVAQSTERRYPGTCRGKPVDRGTPSVMRVALPDVEVPFDDLSFGKVTQHPFRDTGDVAIRDAKGNWTYQFCVVVDDMHDNVDLIVRGEDLLPSTGRQWLLAQLLGRATPPVTLHHPLLYDADGNKLSKRDLSVTVRELRNRGLGRDDIRALAREL